LLIEIRAAVGKKCRFTGSEAVLKHAGRQVGRTDLLAPRGEDESLDQVFELANVSRPGMFFESGEGVGTDLLQRNSVGGAVNLEKIVAKQGNIADTLAEGRKLDRNYMNAVVEIFAEFSGAGHFLEGLIGRADQTEIDFAQIAVKPQKNLLGRILRVQAADSRLRRQSAAEEKAMKAPIKMIFPTVLCIFPAMFIVLLGPAVMNILKVLK